MPAGQASTLVIRILESDAESFRLELDDGAGTRLAEGVLPRVLPPFGAGQDEDPDLLIRQAVLEQYGAGAGKIETIGAYLFQLLAAGGIGNAWHQARAAAPGARTVLDVRARAMARLPWELLSDDGLPAVLPPGGGLVRGEFPFRPAAEPAPANGTGPLRVLIVVGSAEPDLSAESEVAAIQRALSRQPWRVHTEVLVEPSRDDFYGRAGELRPHVLHFLGHGRYAAGTETPVLAMKDAITGKAWSVSATDIRMGLLGFVPRLLVLNACRGAEIDLQNGVWGVVQAGMAAHMPAIVAMQGLVDSAVAVRFSDALYGALIAGEPVDVAVAKARLDIIQAIGAEQRDWALPVLYLSTDPAEVLPVTCGLTADERDTLRRVEEFEEMRKLVDRDEQRRSMWWAMDLPGGRPAGLFGVTGPEKAGRTRLAYSALLTSASRGHHARYVDLRGVRRMSWLEVLYAVRDGQTGGSSLRSPLPAAAFAEFNREIERLAAGQEPRADDPVPAVPPRPGFVATGEHALSYAQRIFTRFTEALTKAAEDRPLTVAIDHLSIGAQGGVLAEDVRTHLSPMLFAPAARGELRRVRLIVVLRDDERDLLGGPVRELMQPVEVIGFSRRLFYFLHREHYARSGHPDESWDKFELILQAIAGDLDEFWPPSLFAWIETAVKGWGSR
ncbi:CHAT domain-containing protein [Actinoplanes solisilvae]|uniref:CHAT domain-containing protein n=1 Tax=Actinoplanes solisilvae TaxID=2486853 RepID=UPI000FD96918|nr:CHAT domain-containing protein [Actinoplanes solisilvae]